MKIQYLYTYTIAILLFVFGGLESLSAQWQNNQTNYKNNTTLDYTGDCTGITTLEFFMKEDFSDCAYADVLQCIDIYSSGPSQVKLASIRERRQVNSQLINGIYPYCNGAIDFSFSNLPNQNYFSNSDGCRDFVWVSYVPGVTFQKIDSGNGLKGKFTFSGLPSDLFGRDTKLRLVGNVAGYGGGGDFDFDFSISEDKQANIEMPNNLNLFKPGCNQVEVRWNNIQSPVPSGCNNADWGVIVYREPSDGSEPLKAIGQTKTSPFVDASSDLLPGRSYTYELRSFWRQNSLRYTQTEPTSGITVTLDNYPGKISGNVTSLTNDGVSGINVTATLNNATDLGCSPVPVISTTVSDVTDANGAYDLPLLFVGANNNNVNASYTVVAELSGRVIGPSSQVIMLNSNAPTNTSVNFTDSSAATISGIVTDYQGCGLGDATISTLGSAGLIEVISQADGTYEMSLPAIGNYEIRSTYRGEELSTNVSLSQLSTPGINFTHTLKDTLRGFVGAGCQEYIGSASISAKVGTCNIASTVTDAQGYYEMIVPSRDVNVKVTDITLTPGSGLVRADVLAAISADSLVAVDSTTTYNVIYRRPLTIEVGGLPPPSCAALPYPVIDQGRLYSLEINIYEGPDRCPVDTGTITINNFISGTGAIVQIDTTFGFTDGVARYILLGGDPKLSGDHLKDLNITVETGNSIEMYNVSALVTGGVQRGETFFTAPVELPFMILRDPPGDQSYSYFKENNSFSYVQSFDYASSNSQNVWLKAKLGAEIFALKVWGSLKGNLQVGATAANSEETVVTITNSEEFMTSSDQLVIGDVGDIYVGAGVNFKYSLADILEFDLLTCSVVKDTSLFLSPNGFDTEYIYTEGHILNTVIPQIQYNIANAIATNKPEEVIKRQQNALNVWQQAIALNKELKEEALNSTIDSLEVKNYSFDANVDGVKKEVTTTRSQSRTINFSSFIDGGVAAELGYEFNGSGVSAGVEVNFRTTMGTSSKTTVSTSNTVGYVYNDDDAGDFISFDVGIDPVYGTPVFGNVIGETSCPHEGKTVRRDDMEISVIGSPVRNVPQGQSTAFFDLEIARIGGSLASNGNRSFTVNIPSDNIPSGITIRSNAGDFPRSVSLAPGEVTTIGVEIIRSPGAPSFTLEGHEFYITPSCNVDKYKKSIYLSAYFESPCSELNMRIPEDDWLITQANSNIMNVVVDDYDIATTIDEIVLEYGNSNSPNWQLSDVILTGAAISSSPNGTSVNWDISDIPDGDYKIRWRLKCNGSTFNYSTRKFGTIDRSAPVAFGKPEPVDDNLIAGDEISVELDQMVDCSALRTSDIKLTSQPDGTSIPVQYDCTGSKIIVLPMIDITANTGASYRVEILNLQDQNGNVSPDTITWDFVINDLDSDGDGISDTYDKCPGGNDYYDTDLGGVPDDCDCDINSIVNEFIEDDDCDNILNGADICPENGDASLHFDGVDDYVSIPAYSALDDLNTDDFSIAAWVYLSEDASFKTIASRSSGVPGRPSFDFSISHHTTTFVGPEFRGKLMLYIAHGADGTWFVVPSSMQVPVNEWSHVAVSFISGGNATPSKAKFWINGVDQGESAEVVIANPLNDNSESILIGVQGYLTSSDHFVPSSHFTGSIDELSIWNKELAQSDVVGMLTKPQDIEDPNLLAYYDFNDSQPCSANSENTLLVSNLSNANNGMLYNFHLDGGCSSNWTSGTNRIKTCKGCEDKLQITSDMGILDGMYSAQSEITIMPGAQFIPSKTVQLSAPLINFERSTEIPITSQVVLDNVGCEDLPFSNKVYVDASANGKNTGRKWEDAYTSLQDALNNASAGHEIWIAKGTYYPDQGANISQGDRAASFVMKNNIIIVGGFAGNESADFDINQRDLIANETILSGNIGAQGDKSDNSYHVIANVNNALNSTAVLDGVTVTGGCADGIDNLGRGGGMLIVSSNPTIINCVFKGNFAKSGGGISAENTSTSAVINSVFMGNEATVAGGAITMAGKFNVSHCSFSGNRSLHPTIANSSNGNAIRVFSNGLSSSITNSIFWGNGESGTSDVVLASGAFWISNCIVDLPNGALYPGSGNINADPLFVQQPTLLGTTGNLRIQAGSSAIDRLNSTSVSTDHDGVMRPNGTKADIGAFEFVHPGS